jgi:hypothetical protein
MIRTLIALPYQLARLPLTIVDETLSERLSETSVTRVALDRTIGSADKLAGAVLPNRTIADRGTDRLERSGKLREAALREEQATVLHERARHAAAVGRSEVAKKREVADELVTRGLQEADATEARGKQEARAKATQGAAAKHAAADRRAAARTAAAEHRKRQVESAVEAKKKATQREAKDQLAAARVAKKTAAAKRADAERLDDLTRAKREQRTQK